MKPIKTSRLYHFWIVSLSCHGAMGSGSTEAGFKGGEDEWDRFSLSLVLYKAAFINLHYLHCVLEISHRGNVWKMPLVAEKGTGLLFRHVLLVV